MIEKKTFEEPTCEVVNLMVEDVITTSDSWETEEI